MLPQSSGSNLLYTTGNNCVNGLTNVSVSSGNNMLPNEAHNNSNHHTVISDNSNINSMMNGGIIIPAGTLLYTHSSIVIPNGTGSQSIEVVYPQNAIYLGGNKLTPRYNTDSNPIPITFIADPSNVNRPIQTIHPMQQSPIKETSHQENQYKLGDTSRLRAGFADSFTEASQRLPLFLQPPQASQQQACFSQAHNSELFARPSKTVRSGMELSEMLNATYVQEMLHNSVQQRVRMAARRMSEETANCLPTQQPPHLAPACNKKMNGTSSWYNGVQLSSLEESTNTGAKSEGNIWHHSDQQVSASNKIHAELPRCMI